MSRVIYVGRDLDFLKSIFRLREGTLERLYKDGWRTATVSPAYGGYQRVGLPNGSCITVHRLVWALENGELPCRDVDHINGDRADNRVENLRLVDRIHNNSNRKNNRNSKSPYKGVYPKGDKWAASLQYNGKRYHCGVFKSEVEAAMSYNQKAKELEVPYRRINIVV